MGRVVNVRHEACDVYAGRPHVWSPDAEDRGNEFIVGKDGTREEVCNRYEEKVAMDSDLLRKHYDMGKDANTPVEEGRFGAGFFAAAEPALAPVSSLRSSQK